MKNGKYNEDEFLDISGGGKGRIRLYRYEDVGYYYFFREDSIINETYTYSEDLDALEARYRENEILRKISRDIWSCENDSSYLMCMYHYQKGLRFLSGSDLKTFEDQRVKAIYKDISIDKNDIKEYTKKEKIWFSISKISLDLVCRIRNKFGYGVE